jgi:hypothetical protein
VIKGLQSQRYYNTNTPMFPWYFLIFNRVKDKNLGNDLTKHLPIYYSNKIKIYFNDCRKELVYLYSDIDQQLAIYYSGESPFLSLTGASFVLHLIFISYQHQSIQWDHQVIQCQTKNRLLIFKIFVSLPLLAKPCLIVLTYYSSVLHTFM